MHSSLSILLAYFLDILLGDPDWLPHPIRGIGKLINYLEKKLRKFISNQRLSGIILTSTVVGLTYLGVFFSIQLAEYINKWVGFATSTILIYTTLSSRSGFAGALGIQLGGTVSYQGKRFYRSFIGKKLREKAGRHSPRYSLNAYLISGYPGSGSSYFMVLA